MKQADWSGRLTREEFENTRFDPWLCTSHIPVHPARRDAFCGNGMIGLRVPAAGEPSIYPESVCGDMAPGGTLMYRLWDTDGLIPAFNFLGLALKFGTAEFRRDPAHWHNYRQTLDWRTGIVHTCCDWQLPQGKVRVETELYLSRAKRNLGCVRTCITPEFDGEFTFVDCVDASFIDNLSGGRCHPYTGERGRVRTFFAEVGIMRHPVAAATILNYDLRQKADETYLRKPDGFVRELTLHAAANRPLAVTKFGVLCSGHDSPDPVNASRTLAAAASDEPELEKQLHLAEWERLWANDVEVDHPGLQMLIHASLYGLYSCLAEGTGAIPGPTGLAGNAWGGRIFWDDDLWMFPPVALLHPELGRNFVDYRFDTLPGARRNAAARNMAGAQFAWESAATGDETIPDLIYARQHHVNSDVALAVWQYYLISGDEVSLRERGAELIIESARFWVSRVRRNDECGRYEIHGVCCADEDAGIRNNNALTNYGAAHTLLLAERAAALTGREVDPRWREIAEQLWIPADLVSGRIIEHDAYAGETIKQADATLLIYPYNIPITDSARRATVDYYRTKYPADKIMMGSAIDGIISAELGNPEEAWEALLDMLPYFYGPFQLVSESAGNDRLSFITGKGGLLQLVMMGFGGLRLREDSITAEPHLPQALNALKIKGLHVHGEAFDLELSRTGARWTPCEVMERQRDLHCVSALT